jgi:hypothetical protein
VMPSRVWVMSSFGQFSALGMASRVKPGMWQGI